ncbi:MAG: ribosome silencing factor [Pseudomonadales bacterium]|jgi:ribosome-associated protein|nr:ribosome silencing factor [Pseudomonadales bacterium]MDP7597635.1 ribosome silencing factor [Pseudomonadales bacterium]HJN53093.1 ribosome silencing factor [Pseudomonadales bacterium]|tara:strand:+ start:1107 stop:1457 length:351 start_codon:yes stop_codon:yes gene_type:complete
MVVDELKSLVTGALDDLKGRNLRCLDVRELTDMIDYMIMVSGTSNRHVRALVNNVVNRCKENGVRPLGVEGEQPGDWVLIDLTDLVVHVMLPTAREFYDLERLWSAFESTDRQTKP